MSSSGIFTSHIFTPVGKPGLICKLMEGKKSQTKTGLFVNMMGGGRQLIPAPSGSAVVARDFSGDSNRPEWTRNHVTGT